MASLIAGKSSILLISFALASSSRTFSSNSGTSGRSSSSSPPNLVALLQTFSGAYSNPTSSPPCAKMDSTPASCGGYNLDFLVGEPSAMCSADLLPELSMAAATFSPSSSVLCFFSPPSTSASSVSLFSATFLGESLVSKRLVCHHPNQTI